MTQEQILDKYGSVEAYKKMLTDRARKGGQKTAALGKSGFKTMTHEQHVQAGKAGHAAMLKRLKENAQ